MSRLLRRLRRSLHRLWRHEDGTVAIEFVLAIPVVFTIFAVSMESSLFMIRQAMMERGLDLAMRDFRLGRMATMDHDDIREQVCARMAMAPNCTTRMRVWIEPVDTDFWAVDTTMSFCGDRNGLLEGPTTGSVMHGSRNELMFVRVCTIEQPIFPGAGIGLRLRADSLTGGYQVAAQTVVVNEPS